jgi:hypothetical protein
MDRDVQFVELMKQKILWEEWYTRRFSGINVGALSPEERELLDMDKQAARSGSADLLTP